MGLTREGEFDVTVIRDEYKILFFLFPYISIRLLLRRKKINR